MKIRQATHAGSWYSDDQSILNQQLSEWLDIAAENNTMTEIKCVRAIIAPHAGYSYSGPTAAYAYEFLRQQEQISHIFILGPSHHVYLHGCALSSAKEYATPLGNLIIDQKINDELRATEKFGIMKSNVDEDEHSIEMHLPYIAKVMEGRQFTIIPILVGSNNAQSDSMYGQLLGSYLRDPCNAIIVSSDFCHWGSRFQYQPYDKSFGEIYEYIEHLDHQGMELIEAQDTNGFQKYLDKTSNTICGRNPISLLMHMIQQSQLKDSLAIKFVKYAQSSHCKRKSDSSVSYASAIVYEKA